MAARILDEVLRFASITADGLPGRLGRRIRRVRLGLRPARVTAFVSQ
jgi:hypothetical protein